MNQHLQKIFDFIQQDEKLTAEEKALLTKAAKSTDSDLSISEFKLDRTEKVKRTTAILLEETIEELEQKRKAVEAQNKELEIETALERVRARTMAMQHSDELAHASFVLDSQVRALGIKTRGCAFNIYGDNESTEWFSSEMGAMPVYKTPREALFLRYFEAGKNGEQIHIEKFEGEACVAHYEYLCALPGIGDGLKAMIAAGGSLPTHQIDHAVYFKYGYLLFITADEVPEAHDIFIRFAKVFEQTYTRFLDLQKAEAQAREASIEAALEKVRSRTLGMHNSDELFEVINVVSEQLQNLQFTFDSASFAINHSSEDLDFWLSSPGQPYPAKIHIPYLDHPIVTDMNEAKSNGLDFFADSFSFSQKNEWLQHLFLNTKLRHIPEERKNWLIARKGFARSSILMKHITLSIVNYEGIPYRDEENAIFKRFATVFEQSYTRFLDLQKAEAQAKESQIEAALERVRSRTLAMQKSDELAETAAVLFRQLILLGIQPNRLYIALVKDDIGNTEFWITDEDGTKVSSAFETNLNDNPTFKKMFDGWKQERKSLVIDMQGEELQEYFKYLSSIHVPFKGGLTQKRRVQDIAYFSKGFIGMASPEEQPAETLQLLERFAYTFNLTFTRFSDLKLAEAQAIQAEEDLIKLQAEKKRAEEALTELRATQTQLIQSEKMASLGELTAGIAHEIQNPLNFVNNFSEVSIELMKEMVDEAEKGNTEEVKSIVDDIIQNLEKINHHGKRADAIVKGMLQHSRTTSATKEQTDINKLADEYLRLAYHGIRAKDKSFNATLKTDYDESIGNISIISQDIGRVILNLLTNAFYAVAEKKKQKSLRTSEGETSASRNEVYEAIVSVTTRRLSRPSGGWGAEITVTDNGNGIPSSVKEKIFQPFFTTKPTGQGTGLGLSLAYDIVKVHGGEIKVDSKEQAGTTFVIEIPAST